MRPSFVATIARLQWYVAYIPPFLVRCLSRHAIARIGRPTLLTFRTRVYQSYDRSPYIAPFLFFDLKSSSTQGSGRSYENKEEVRFVVELFQVRSNEFEF